MYGIRWSKLNGLKRMKTDENGARRADAGGKRTRLRRGKWERMKTEPAELTLAGNGPGYAVASGNG